MEWPNPLSINCISITLSILMQIYTLHLVNKNLTIPFPELLDLVSSNLRHISSKQSFFFTQRGQYLKISPWEIFLRVPILIARITKYDNDDNNSG